MFIRILYRSLPGLDREIFSLPDYPQVALVSAFVLNVFPVFEIFFSRDERLRYIETVAIDTTVSIYFVIFIYAVHALL